jgi:hypothetical protein
MHINRRKNDMQRKGHYQRSAARVSRAGRGASYDAEVLTWDSVCFAVPTSRVELVWKAVRARHPGRQFHLPPPMCEANQFSSWSRKLSGSARFGAIPWRRSCPSRRRRCAGCLRGGRARRRYIARAVVAADGGCHTGLPASQRGRATAGVRAVVQLPDVGLCTRLDGALAACVAAGHAGAASPGTPAPRRARRCCC